MGNHIKTKKHLLAIYRGDPRVCRDPETFEDASALTKQELIAIIAKWKEGDEYEHNRKERLGLDTCPDWL
jgi:hypothetical protein